jgi:hypothetical protein
MHSRDSVQVHKMISLVVSVSLTEIFNKPRSLTILVQFVWGGPVGIFKYGSRKKKYLGKWNGYNHFRFALDFSYAFGIL